MEALIVKKIEIERRDLPTRSPVYHEAIPTVMHAFSLKEGEMPDSYSVTTREKIYEAMRIINPETKETKTYYVNVDERKLWNELIAVSDGFINEKIAEGVEKFRDRFLTFEIPDIQKAAYKRGVESVRELPWWKKMLGHF